MAGVSFLQKFIEISKKMKGAVDSKSIEEISSNPEGNHSFNNLPQHDCNKIYIAGFGLETL